MGKQLQGICIKIKGVEYNVLKPSAVDLIKIEDALALSNSGGRYKYLRSLIDLIDTKIVLEDLVKKEHMTVSISGEELTFGEISFKDWTNLIADAGFDRVAHAKEAIKLCGADADVFEIDTLKYSEIVDLHEKLLGLYDIEELMAVVSEIETFCRG